MNKAIILSVENPDLIEQTVRAAGFDHIVTFAACSEARRFMQTGSLPDLVVVNTPLPDEFGTEFAESAALETGAKVLVICPSHIAELAENLADSGAVVISKPFSRESLTGALQRLEADMLPFGDMRESDDILSRTDDIRLINKAKSVLMKCLHFTEPQAHRHLEKLAMNNRCTRREAAEQIINTYK